MTEPRALSLSVTDLVEFSARSGDLYPENAGGPSALEGVLAHQKIQRQRGPEWQREVTLKHQWQLADYKVTLHGRVDLLNPGCNPVVIEEIKTLLIPPAQLPPGKLALFEAQVLVYAGLYQQLHPETKGELELRLCLYNLKDDKIHSESRFIDGSEALAETERLLCTYLDWHRQVAERLARSRASAKSLTFPFPAYRPGQHALAADIYRCIRRGGILLAEAPTGTGKTLTGLFPACKALADEALDQVLYLTAKTTSQRPVETTAQILREQGLELDALTLCARDKLCPCRTGESDPRRADGVCSYTLGFWDRLPAARQASLAEPELNSTTLTALGHAHQVCPFALGLHLAPWRTLVIGDYNYFFDPLTRLRCFAKGGANRVLLMDEVHNLPERARAMYSASLGTGDIKVLAARHGGAIRRKCRQILKLMRQLAAGEPVLAAPPAPLLEQLAELGALLLTEPQGPATGQSDLLTPADAAAAADDRAGLTLYGFCVVAGHFGAGHICLVQREQDEARIQLLCLDPSAALQACYTGHKTVIGFSATLNPLAFYRQLLGLPEQTNIHRLPYPFPRQNLLTLRCDYLDTRWQARQQSLAGLAELLVTVVRARPGKYLAFFPSHEYLQTAHQAFIQSFGQIKTVLQNPGSSPADRDAFLRLFFADAEPILGFAVMGGIFAEGVDYLGDALHGAVIVGTGMPQPGREQGLMADHFAAQGLNPYQYAYQFPGFARVQQTAGRVIRAETDKGVVVLVDPRFARADFRALMPEHWQPKPCRDRDSAARILADFWG